MGLPIVATNIRGCRQVVGNSIAGLMVVARDVDALTQVIDRLLADAGLRRSMAVVALDKAIRAFDDRTQIAITLERYAAAGTRRLPTLLHNHGCHRYLIIRRTVSNTHGSRV